MLSHCGSRETSAPIIIIFITTGSGLVRFSGRNGHGGQNLVLENKSLDPLKDPEEDEQDADVLDPGELDGFPEARTISEGSG